MSPRTVSVLLVVLLVSTARAADNQLTDREKSEGWILLFDGKTLQGWSNNNDKPLPEKAIQDGAFNPHAAGSYVPYYARQKFGDFTLTLDFKVTKGCNSGVFFRVANPKDPVQSGFEIQVMDSAGKANVGKHDSGSLYDAVAPTQNAAKPAGEWQNMRISARGNQIEVILNGQKIVDANLDQWTKPGQNPDGTKNKYKTAYKDMARQGYVGVQDHNHDVWFKNIKIKPLK